MGIDNRPGSNRLEWHEDMPYSTEFGDYYYSRADGRAECRHVFLSGNGLPERWVEQPRFTIAELGFGTGLNFIETWHRWQTRHPTGGHLTFVSFERFPMRADEMRRALGAWPELMPGAKALIDAWPAQPSGSIQLRPEDTVTLTVHIGDARTLLTAWDGLADAWYLDGFAPDRNPELWSADLMRDVHAHTAPGGTFATYSAAGWVRRNLETAGFTVHKAPGFAGKRDMSRGARTVQG